MITPCRAPGCTRILDSCRFPPRPPYCDPCLDSAALWIAGRCASNAWGCCDAAPSPRFALCATCIHWYRHDAELLRLVAQGRIAAARDKRIGLAAARRARIRQRAAAREYRRGL